MFLSCVFLQKIVVIQNWSKKQFCKQNKIGVKKIYFLFEEDKGEKSKSWSEDGFCKARNIEVVTLKAGFD